MSAFLSSIVSVLTSNAAPLLERVTGQQKGAGTPTHLEAEKNVVLLPVILPSGWEGLEVIEYQFVEHPSIAMDNDS